MTKHQLRLALYNGAKLEDLFDFTYGQDCLVYKGEWNASDDIIYIPDIYLNDIPIDRMLNIGERIHVIDCMYTGKEIVEICGGNERLAKDCFSLCDWQHPATEINEYYDLSDEEMIEICGQTYDEIF